MVKSRMIAVALTVGGCTTILGVNKDYVVGDDSGGGRADAGDAGSAEQRDSSGIAGDSGVRNVDAATDGGCAGHICNGVCEPGHSCGTCGGATLLCVTTRSCVSSCGSCGLPDSQACFACLSADAGAASGTCEPPTTASCLTSNYSHCGCFGVQDCPGRSQVCVAERCLSCGEPASDGYACRTGDVCDARKIRCD
jgi:hypothetical protein